MPIILNCIALCIFSIGTYFVWWDRRNVMNHLLIGFCIIGYIIPSAILSYDLLYDKDIIDLFIKLNVIGVCFFIIGIFLGYKWKTVPIVDSVIRFSRIEDALYQEDFGEKVLAFASRVYVISLITMLICFIFMGYIPMFASDPYMAKQFKGVYQPSYVRVALFYRTAKEFVGLLLPFLVIDLYINRTVKSAVLTASGIIIIFVTMSRGEAITGLLLALSIIVSLKRGKLFFLGYIIFVVVVFSLGSGLWALLSFLFPNSGFVTGFEGLNGLEAIASGAPDISDQLTLLTSFVNNHIDYTYGMTFLGGLIPFNFKWNPSVWTLSIINQKDDISEIASGGLRVPLSLWGYFSYGWVGVAVIPFISAFFTGYVIKNIKIIAGKIKANFNGMIIFYILIFVYNNIALVFVNFVNISIYSLPAFLFYGYIFYSKRITTWES